jgi:hypothetical protein
MARMERAQWQKDQKEFIDSESELSQKQFLMDILKKYGNEQWTDWLKEHARRHEGDPGDPSLAEKELMDVLWQNFGKSPILQLYLSRSRTASSTVSRMQAAGIAGRQPRQRRH